MIRMDVLFNVRSRKCKISVNFLFRSFIYGLIEREKLVTDIYFLFRFGHYFAEKNAKQLEQLQMSYIQLHRASFTKMTKFQGYLFS